MSQNGGNVWYFITELVRASTRTYSEVGTELGGGGGVLYVRKGYQMWSEPIKNCGYHKPKGLRRDGCQITHMSL